MRHAHDEVSTAIDVAARVLSTHGRSEPPEMDNPEIGWGVVARDGVWVPTRDRQRIHIGITGTADDRVATVVRPGLRVFAGIDPSADLVAQTTTNGVRFVIVVHGPDAPAEFRFPLRLPGGLTLEPVPSGGYDVVHERYGATVGRLHAPWGRDALFNQVKAEYRLEGATLVTVVPHHGAGYPVVVDPRYAR